MYYIYMFACACICLRLYVRMCVCMCVCMYVGFIDACKYLRIVFKNEDA